VQFADEPETDLLDAISDLRQYIIRLAPPGPSLDAAEVAFRRVEACARESVAIRNAAACGDGEGFFVLAPEAENFRWVSASAGMAGLTRRSSSVLADTLLSETPYAAAMYARCSAVRDGRSAATYDERIALAGCSIDLRTRLVPVLDADGACSRIVGIVRDVTEQRSAERQLRKQNRRLQNVIGSMTDGFVSLDADGCITFVNGQAEQILGRERSALAGASLLEAVPELAAEALTSSTERVCALAGAPARWVSTRAYQSKDGTSIYLQDVSERMRTEGELKQGLERAQASLDGVVNAMAFAVEMRDPYTGGHQRRVGALACAIARELGFPGEQMETLRIAGLLHDVGKISIPAEILNRPGKLSEPERIIVRTHAQIGYEILKEIEFSSPVALIALQHHERLDGSGYPQGLHADTIIPEARILAVADVVEAMASHRPYRAALGVESALQEVLSHRGVRYDDFAVGACLSVFAESGFDFDQLMQTELDRRHAGDAAHHEKGRQ
jgi:putative nucleotidyltransferase with HDIG domain/PAS domain S-box-containing protein